MAGRMKMEPVQIFKTLADETRFKLLGLLLARDLCVGALANHLKISEAAVSQHLKQMRKAGLVKGEKRGYWTHYTVEKEKLRELSAFLRDLADMPACFDGVRIKETDNIMDCGKRKEKMCACQHQQPKKLTAKRGERIPVRIGECGGDAKHSGDRTDETGISE